MKPNNHFRHFPAWCLCLLAVLFSCSKKSTAPPPVRLIVEPTTLTQIAFCGGLIGSREIVVSSSSGDSISFTATKSKTWLTLTNASGTTPGKVSVTFNVGPLDIGEYTDTIIISSPQADNSVSIEVRLSVGSQIVLSSQSLTFRGLALSEDPPAQEIRLSDVCPTGYSFTLTKSVPWLSFDPESGTAPDTITVAVDIAGLPTGIYTETITIDAPQALNSPQNVLCTLTVSGWLPQENPNAAINPQSNALRSVTFTDEQHGWAVGVVGSNEGSDGYIVSTTTGGEEWLPESPLLRDPALADVVFVNADMGWAVGSDGIILHTSDGGLNWVAQPSGTLDNLWGLTFIDVDTGWAVGVNGTILRTVDAGSNWVRQYTDSALELSDIVFVNARHGWTVGNAGTILHTTNGGTDWLAQSISPLSSNLRDVYFADSVTGWAVGSGGTILHTIDGGDNWIAVMPGFDKQLLGIWLTATGQGWAVGEEGTILHTSDGVNWVPQVSGATETLYDVCFINDNIGWVVGAKGTILHTANGGE
jgi:photosystem II stability/assembly factor-like uncharacterized protein